MYFYMFAALGIVISIIIGCYLWEKYRDYKKSKFPKVFCVDCKWHKKEDAIRCHSPWTSVSYFSKDDYFRKGTGKVTFTDYQECYKLNKDNHCFWYNKD
jgi:hypothetical protein